MRIDKYLWAMRYYKTRNMASEACKKNQVKVNTVICKPSKDVFPGDAIVIRKNQINYQLIVLDLPKSRVGAKLVDQYRKDTTPPEAFKHLELLKQAKEHYRGKGTGRPTKKDRRDIENYKDDN